MGLEFTELLAKYEPIFIEYRRRNEIPSKLIMLEEFEELYYAMLGMKGKFSNDFVQRSPPLRAEKRRALRLEPIQPYQ